MHEIILTHHDLPALNPESFTEELTTVLRMNVSVSTALEAGRVKQVIIRRPNGFEFTQQQLAAIQVAAAAHDPTLPSSRQIAAKERAAERRAASRVLLQYDPSGIAAALESAESFNDLVSASAQLADLVAVLATLMRTQKEV